jgi:hypothetical protein
VGACGDGTQVAIAISAPPELVSTFDEFVEFIPGPRLAVVGADDAMPAAGYRIEVATDLGGCTECYRIEPMATDARGWVVHASDRLGAQYGVAEVFELLGYRFRHPFDTYVPARPTPDAAGSRDCAPCARRRCGSAGCTCTRCIRSRPSTRCGRPAAMIAARGRSSTGR